jgi:diguanylate cyclase (GGDEF)-like protein
MVTAFTYIVTLAGFVSLVVFCVRRIVGQIEADFGCKLDTAQGVYQALKDRKLLYAKEKMGLQNKALEIFTLYEISKEITKSLNEEEAFEIFKNKLNEHVDFKECRYLESNSKEVKALRKDDECFVLPLQSKRKKIGYLAIKGVSSDEKEKFMILGHQFALALRRVQLYQEIEQIAITDGLTEVYTRYHALERFGEELKRSKMRRVKMSFLMIDVDYFKRFNDKHGHLTGDQILRGVGLLIKDNIREIDIAGRYGGEEFCVILPDTDRQGAHYAAERIRQAAEKATIKAYDTTVNVTVSIGTATFSDDGQNRDELIDKADCALYRCKKSGRNTVCSFGVYNNESH